MLKSTAAAAAVALGLSVACGASDLRAEVDEVILGQQFGAVYLPQMVMEHLQLTQKHLAAAGMPDVKVSWKRLGGPAALNDAIISGNLHFAAQGVPSMAVLWDRTRGNIGMKAVACNANNNIWLHTRNTNVKSLRDFTDKDRIAVPSLKVSTQAFMLHYAVDKIWGNYTHLDHIIVPLPHPEALAAVLNPVSEITAHFATSPFHEKEAKAGLPVVTTAYEIMGGPTTGLTFTSTEKFRRENPKVFAAAVAAFDEAMTWINADKQRAAALYIEMTRDRNLTVEELAATMSSPDMQYTKVPSNVSRMVEFMHRVGLIKTKPASWKDLFFEEAHSLPGT